MSSQNIEPGKLLGVHVVVTTSLSEDVEGEIFCYDIEKSNSVILRHHNERGHVSYKWLKTNIIRSVRATSQNPNANEEKLPAVNLDEVEKNAQRAENQAKADMKNYGVGVTARAQLIFDALNRTMACEWDNEDIIVFGIRIRSPYDPASCVKKDDNSDTNALDRVKKVLDGELQRIEKKTKQKGSDKKDEGDDS